MEQTLQPNHCASCRWRVGYPTGSKHCGSPRASSVALLKNASMTWEEINSDHWNWSGFPDCSQVRADAAVAFLGELQVRLAAGVQIKGLPPIKTNEERKALIAQLQSCCPYHEAGRFVSAGVGWGVPNGLALPLGALLGFIVGLLCR